MTSKSEISRKSDFYDKRENVTTFVSDQSHFQHSYSCYLPLCDFINYITVRNIIFLVLY